MDWPEVSKYRGILSAQNHRQEIIQDLYKQTHDEKRGLVHSGMIRYRKKRHCPSPLSSLLLLFIICFSFLLWLLMAYIVSSQGTFHCIPKIDWPEATQNHLL